MAAKVVTHVCDANQLFSKELYQILSKTNGNILYSGLSIHAILSLLLQGASGQTAAQLKKALQLCDSEISAKGYQEVMQALNLEENVQLHVANKIFVNEEYHLQEKIGTLAKDFFLSEIENISFFPKTAEAAKTMNDWVSNKTNNKINNIMNKSLLEETTRLVLINAIYFYGRWAIPFRQNSTKKENFHVSETEKMECNMMNMRSAFKYSDDFALNAQLLLIPYKNRSFEMLIILPKSATGMRKLEEKLKSVNLKDLSIFSSDYVDVILSLPKFQIEATIHMEEALRQMDLDILFNEYCDLSKFLTSPERINVDSIIQKAYIEVSEEGTEATCAVRVVCKRVICKRVRKTPPPVVFNADHPFFFCICYNNKDKELLPIFSGKIERPSFV